MEGRQKLPCVSWQRNAAGKSMLAPWAYSYLIEITGRPVHLFRLSYTSWLSLKSVSPAQLYQRDSSSRCRQDEPGCSETCSDAQSLCFWKSRWTFFVCITVMCFWVWGKCGWCKKNFITTPLWFTDLTQCPPCVGYKHTVPPHDLTMLNNPPLHHLKYINNAHKRKMRAYDYATKMPWFQFCL